MFTTVGAPDAKTSVTNSSEESTLSVPRTQLAVSLAASSAWSVSIPDGMVLLSPAARDPPRSESHFGGDLRALPLQEEALEQPRLYASGHQVCQHPWEVEWVKSTPRRCSYPSLGLRGTTAEAGPQGCIDAGRMAVAADLSVRWVEPIYTVDPNASS